MADQAAPRSPQTPASQSTRQLLDDLDALMQRMLALPVNQNEAEDEAKGDSSAPLPPPNAQPPAAPAALPHSPTFSIVPMSTVTVQQPVAGKPAQYLVGRETQSAKPTPAVQAPPAQPTPVVQTPVVKLAAIVPAPSAKPAPVVQAPFVKAAPVVQTAPRLDDKHESLGAPTYVPMGAEPLLPILLQRPKSMPEKNTTLVLPSSAIGVINPLAKPPTATRPAVMKTPPPTHTPAAANSPAGVTQLLVGINRAFDRGTTLFGPAGRWLRSEHCRTILGWAGIAMMAVAAIWTLVQFLG